MSFAAKRSTRSCARHGSAKHEGALYESAKHEGELRESDSIPRRANKSMCESRDATSPPSVFFALLPDDFWPLLESWLCVLNMFPEIFALRQVSKGVADTLPYIMDREHRCGQLTWAYRREDTPPTHGRLYIKPTVPCKKSGIFAIFASAHPIAEVHVVGGMILPHLCGDFTYRRFHIESHGDSIRYTLERRPKEIIAPTITFDLAAIRAYVTESPHPCRALREYFVYSAKESAIRDAAKHGWVNVLRYFKERDGVTLASYKTAAIVEASSQGHIDAVFFLRDVTTTQTLPPGVDLSNALANGHTDLATRLLLAGTDVTFDTVVHCVKQGRLDMIVFLKRLLREHDKGDLPLEDLCLETAAVCGHIDIVEWLWHQGCLCDEFVLTSAALEGQVAVVEWLCRMNAPRAESLMTWVMQRYHATGAGESYRAISRLLASTS